MRQSHLMPARTAASSGIVLPGRSTSMPPGQALNQARVERHHTNGMPHLNAIRPQAESGTSLAAGMALNISTWQTPGRLKFSPNRATALGLQSAVHGILELFASLELRILRRRDLDRFAGPWIAALRRSAMRHRKRPESDNTNVISILESTRNGVQYRFNSAGRIALGQACPSSHARYQVVLVHASVLS